LLQDSRSYEKGPPVLKHDLAFGVANLNEVVRPIKKARKLQISAGHGQQIKPSHSGSFLKLFSD
jgi:hypothetical protein